MLTKDTEFTLVFEKCTITITQVMTILLITGPIYCGELSAEERKSDVIRPSFVIHSYKSSHSQTLDGLEPGVSDSVCPRQILSGALVGAQLESQTLRLTWTVPSNLAGMYA